MHPADTVYDLRHAKIHYRACKSEGIPIRELVYALHEIAHRLNRD
jgi:hypothetical protein